MRRRHAPPGAWGFYLALRLGLLLARILPPGWIIAAGARLGRQAGRFAPSRRIVRENLRLIKARPIDPIRAQAGDVFASYGRYWGEFLVLAVRPHLLARFEIRPEGLEHLKEAAGAGPVCILTGHLGNWDLGARWAARELGNLAVVAEQLRPPGLYALFRRLREDGGLRVISAGQGGLALSRHLREGGHVAMVADRPFGAGNESVPFFDGARSLPASGMRLARQLGARLLPAFLWREGKRFVVRFHPALAEGLDPVPAFARILEEEILAHAEQWCVLGPLLDDGESSPLPWS